MYTVAINTYRCTLADDYPGIGYVEYMTGGAELRGQPYLKRCSPDKLTEALKNGLVYESKPGTYEAISV